MTFTFGIKGGIPSSNKPQSNVSTPLKLLICLVTFTVPLFAAITVTPADCRQSRHVSLLRPIVLLQRM
jgi:hypothetical protein